MRNQLRDDIRLAAYAVSLGYKLKLGLPSNEAFTEMGDPKTEMSFVYDYANHGATIEVALTSMGWRIFKEDNELAPGQISKLWLRPDPSADFFTSLKKALDQGVLR